MRKLVLFLSMILVGVGSVFAQYVWKGGTEINSTLWAQQASWDNWDPTTINDYRGVGPATHDSGSWAEIQIKGTAESRISGETPELEGWNLKMVLDYATVTIPSVTKMQAPNGAYFTLSGNSELNFKWNKTTRDKPSFSVNLNAEDASVFNFIMGSNYLIGSNEAISVNYGVVSNGMSRRINVSSNDGSTARTLSKLVINATLPDVEAATATLNSAVIATVGTGVTITTKTYNITSNDYTYTYTEAAADVDLSSDLSNNVGKYKIVESGGDIVLQWVTGPVSTITFNYTATFEEGNTFTTSLVRKYKAGTVLTEAPSLASEFYTAEPINHTVSADATVNVTLNPKFPFVHNVPTWLSSIGNTTNGGLRQVKYVSDSHVAIDVDGNSKVVSKEHAWTFVHVNGTADQFQIRNGLGKYLHAPGTSGVCTMSETPQTFTIQRSAVTANDTETEKGFCIMVEENSYLGAHNGNSNAKRTIGNISNTWTNNQLGTWKDAGSTVSNNGNLFYAIKPSDAESIAINVKFQMVSDGKYAASAKMIESGARGTSVTAGDYTTYWTLVPTSTMGEYKVRNVYSGFYLGSAETVNLTTSEWAGIYSVVAGSGSTQKLRLKGDSDKYLAIDAEGKLSLTVAGTEWNITEVSTEGLQSVRSGYEEAKGGEIADISQLKTQYIGSGVGQYTPTSEQSNVIQDAIDLSGNMGSLTGNEIDKKVIPAQELFSVGKMSINQPAAGFYRIKFATNASTPYIGSTGDNDGVYTIDMTAAEDVSSIFYIEDGEDGKKYLMMYTNGYYVANPYRYGVGTKIIPYKGSEEIYKQSWTVEEGDFGKYALKYGSGNYLTGNAAKTGYAYEKNANSKAWTFEPLSSLPLSTNEDGYTSFSAPVPVTIPENCYAYAATSKGDGVINMSKVTGNVAANTGLIIKTVNPSAALTFNIVETGDAVANNKLVANVAAAEVDKESNYFFGKYESEYVFTKISGTGTRDLMGHKAYLNGESFSGARLNIYWDEQVETGIENTEGVLETTRNGLFIENGRVLVVKEGRRYTTVGQRMR